MSSPYPPQPPKKLERSKSNRIVGGVCAGVANYLNMDPTLVRVLTVVISLFTGVPVILYIVALFVMPEEGSQPNPPNYPPVGGPQAQAGGYSPTPQQTTPPAYAPYTSSSSSAPAQPQSSAAGPASADDSVWGSEGAPWEQRAARSGAGCSAAGGCCVGVDSQLVHPSRRRRSYRTLTRKTPLNRHLSLRGQRSARRRRGRTSRERPS